MSVRIKFNDYQKNTVYEKYSGECAICGEPISKRKMVISHKIPLSKGGTNAIDNLMLSCSICCQMKQDLLMDDFLLKIQTIFWKNEKRINML